MAMLINELKLLDQVLFQYFHRYGHRLHRISLGVFLSGSDYLNLSDTRPHLHCLRTLFTGVIRI